MWIRSYSFEIVSLLQQDFLQSDYRSFFVGWSLGLFFLVSPLFRICQQVWTDCSREGLFSVSHNKSSPLTPAARIRSCSPGLTEMRLVMCNFILWQQVGSDQGSRASVTKPPALWERRGPSTHFLLFLALFVTAQHQTMADTDYKDQIRRLRGAEQRKLKLLNIELTCYHVTSPEQYAAVAENIFRFKLVLLL